MKPFWNWKRRLAAQIIVTIACLFGAYMLRFT